jgi:N-acetylneuraminate synthase
MDPRGWREMVDRTRELERALGSAEKFVAGNERETVVIQRRCLRAARDLHAGDRLTRDKIAVLRPADPDAIPPHEIARAVGTAVLSDVPAGAALRWTMLGD